MNRRPLLIPAFFLLASLSAGGMLAACDPASTESPAQGSGATVASLEITGPLSAQAGDSVALAAVARDDGGNILAGIPVTWSSSDSALIGVTDAGLVRAHRIATVVVRASAGGARDSVTFAASLHPFAFAFPDTLSTATRRLILDGVQDAQGFQRAAFGRAVSESTTVIGAVSNAACASGGAAAATTAHTVIFCLDNPGWIQNGPVMRQKIVQHETFHAWQFEAGWLGADPNASGATWLIEGSAELMGFRGIAARGLISLQTALGCQVKESADFATRNPPGLPALSSVESRQAFQTTVGPLYTHAMLAADLLAGTDLSRLRAYGDSIAAGVAWQTAFQQAFGKTPTSFYAEFPGYVAGLAVPPNYLCGI